MKYKIEDIEGIGAATGQKLRDARIEYVHELLSACATRKGRSEVSAQTGIGEAQLLKWTNHADLMRNRGVAGEYAELLEASGVDTVKELGHRNAENLAERMREVNEEKSLTRNVPAASTITGWVEQASELVAVVTH